ncbi:hypothetical protein ACFLUJ_04925, partial [Chloroflexota bacterium]
PAKRRTKATPSPEPEVEKTKKTLAEPVAEVSPAVGLEEKPAKPPAKRRTKATPSPKPEVEKAKETLTEPVAEDSSVTT